MLKRIICRLRGHDWAIITPWMPEYIYDPELMLYPKQPSITDKQECQRCKLTREV